MSAIGARAVRFDRYGGRDVLYVTDIPMPVPASGEVVVAVKATGINPGEAAIRSGALDARFPATFPSGEGSDLAGVVTESARGSNSSRSVTRCSGSRGPGRATPPMSRSR